MPVPILVVACVWGIFRSLRLQHEALPFLLTLALCFLGYSGLLISIWPNIVPPSLTIWEASSSHASQLFTLVGTVIVLPVILVYNAMQYRVFRGKVREGDAGYH
jgi:cytochrome d ubiquinol oxidase subunit II